MRFLATLALIFACTTAQAATITIVNGDGFGEGLNDPTPKSSVGGNEGATLGQQRRIALQAAADVWGARIVSSVEIRVNAKFNPIPGCTASSGTVGSAGATSQFDFGADPPPGAYPDTFYPIALAEALSGSNLNGINAEINATFNSDVDGPTCFGNRSFHYGIEPGGSASWLAFFPVALHELGHGLGFASLSCTDPAGCGETPMGGFLNDGNVDDVWSRFLGTPGGVLWADLDDEQRAVSMTSDPDLVWTGPFVTATAGGLGAGTNAGFVRMHAPSPSQPGSSVSHFTTEVAPDEVMEPIINLSAVVHDPGRAVRLLRDIGWRLPGGDPYIPLFRNGFEN